ncbi:uncharacterized protein LOC125032934 [Penaeus chinensis]|uniref:uncharacterized protein LOC125032934 n=1 Tax=Penaeus chinensis TaxID=139456 RepID=UPI001FB7C42A|nr:uncharacterized protein LOC125032934 [Penaeus chinensis]
MILRVLAASALLAVCAAQGCVTPLFTCENWSPAGPTTIEQPCPAECSTKDNPSATCYIQNECDCTSYFTCRDDVYTLKCCGRGLYWDMETRTCDDLEHANCDSRPYETLPPTTTTTTTTITTTSSTPVPDNSSTPVTPVSTVSTVTTTTVPPTPPPAIENSALLLASMMCFVCPTKPIVTCITSVAWIQAVY